MQICIIPPEWNVQRPPRIRLRASHGNSSKIITPVILKKSLTSDMPFDRSDNSDLCRATNSFTSNSNMVFSFSRSDIYRKDDMKRFVYLIPIKVPAPLNFVLCIFAPLISAQSQLLRPFNF